MSTTLRPRPFFWDLETYNEHVDIRDGTYRYAETCEVMLLSWILDDGEVGVWDLTETPEPPSRLITEAASATEFWAHNATFDRTVLRLKHPWLCPPTEMWRCTMAQAQAHSLPGKLEKLGEIMGLAEDQAKAKDGQRLILKFCKPAPKNHRVRRYDRHNSPEDWARFEHYCAQDTIALRALHRKLPRWNYPDNATELAQWHQDQRMNDRGMAVDLDLVHAAVRASATATKRMNDRVAEGTEGAALAVGQRDRILTFLKEAYDLDLPDLRATTVEKALDQLSLPPEVVDVLTARLIGSKTSTSKYKRLLKAVSEDGRLRGTTNWCGAARTGRIAGRIFNPLNLPRPTLKNWDIELGIEALKLGAEEQLYGDGVMELCSSAVRGAIICEPGKKLAVADLSAIEDRMLAWLAGEEWKLQAYRDYDAGHGFDLYKMTYSKSFGVPPDKVTSEQRQIGKVASLAFGYGGNIGAWSTMATAYGIDPMPDERVLELVRAWRQANKTTTRFWYALARAWVDALNYPGEVVPVRRVKVLYQKPWLLMRLPSGRLLCYANPQIGPEGELSYMGTNQWTRKWERIPTYFGKIAENITQAAARDTLTHGLALMEPAGYEPVLTVYDEVVAEVPDTPAYSSDQLAAFMSAVPPWAEGLPLAAQGFETHRYRK